MAIAPEPTYGVVLEAEARQGDYIPPAAHDAALSQRVSEGIAHLEQAGARKVYLACMGPTFRETDLAALQDYFGHSRLAGITLFSAAALLRIVEESIRTRASFRLSQFAARLAGYNLVVDAQAVDAWFREWALLQAARAGA